MEKVLKSSRAFPLGQFDYHQIFVRENDGYCIFVKKCETFFDVLVIIVNSSYICRYKFPDSWKLNEIYKFIIQREYYGTIQETRTEQAQQSPPQNQ